MSLFPEEDAKSDAPPKASPRRRTLASTEDSSPEFAPPFESLPLAARMRPRTFDEYAGQKHLVAPGATLRRAIEADRAPSCLFFGPAGTGKTTLARLCATLTQAHFEDFSAVTGGVADVRRIIGEAKARRSQPQNADLRAHEYSSGSEKASTGDAARSSTASNPDLDAPHEYSCGGANQENAQTSANNHALRNNSRRGGQRTILFVDEIHRFNRAQQDAFLPHVEDGTVTLIGATTENPLATVNTPLLSRCRLFRFEPLSDEAVIALLGQALHDERGLASLRLQTEDAALQHIARCALGDARTALNALEMTGDLAGQGGTLSLVLAEEAVGRRALDYDKSGDSHYHIISAYIKSLRGGDPDAALVWMVRMLDAGEDPMFIARRLVIQASEDIGNADPHALPLAMAALQSVEKIGMPECAIPLAQATIYVACAPKSNASYVALGRAREALKSQVPPIVPNHLRAASLRGARERLGEGIGYINPHDSPGHFARQDYLPSGWKTEPFYEPGEEGYEPRIARRLEQWWSEEEDEV